MSDSKLRELERRWQETRAIDDEVALHRERLRVGEISPERLAVAACCGSTAAKAALGRSLPPLRRDIGEFVGAILQVGGVEAGVRAAVAALAECGTENAEVRGAVDLALRWFREKDRREPIEDDTRRNLPAPAVLMDATRELPPSVGAALSLRTMVAFPFGDDSERRRHAITWCKTTIGLVVDHKVGRGRIWANPRRPMPSELMDTICADLVGWALRRAE